MAIPGARGPLKPAFTTVRDLGSRFEGLSRFVDVALRM